MSHITIPENLKQAIRQNKLLIFVGAGLSYSLINEKGETIGGWGNLVKGIIKEIHSNDYNAEILLPLLDYYNPIDILHLIEIRKNFPKEKIYDFTKSFLELDDSKNDYSLHRNLFALSKKIITTNYDTAFERALPKLRKRTAYKGKNYELTKHKDPDSELLFKLHGCYENSESMVLFPSNYRELYNASRESLDAEHSLLVLKNIIFNNTILFIGTGMGDFQINNIFENIKRVQQGYGGQHYIITNKTLDSTLEDFLTPITIEGYEEIPVVIDQLITIKKEFESQESEEVRALKKDLKIADDKIKEADDRIKELELQKRDSSKELLLEREALKYFRKGLQYQLSKEYQKAIKKYKTGLELSSNLPEIHNNWGICIANLANAKEGKEKKKLYEEAFTHFSNSIKVDKSYAAAYYNWANNLVKIAMITSAEKKSDSLYKEAIEKYKEAIQVDSDFHEAYYNLGNLYVRLARAEKDETSKELYLQALKSYEGAIKANTDKHEAYNNCGIVLATLAEKEEGKEAENLYKQASDRYEQAVKIKKDYNRAYYNWGTLLTGLARNKTGEEKEKLYQEASEKYLKSIEHGGKRYNLACLYVIQDKKEEALFYLEKSIINEEITTTNVLKDSDWKNYLDDPDFLAIIEKYQ